MFLKSAAAVVLACAALNGVVTAPAMAQTPWNSTITGTVYDRTGAVLPAATVTIAAPTLIGGARTTLTNDDGLFRLTVLPAGTYEVVTRLDGFGTVRRTDVRVPASATVVIDFSLEIAGVVDRLDIRAQSPMVDVKSAAAPVRLDADMLHNLPTSRAIESLINLVPGVSADVSFGGSQKSNEILVDGVRGTEPLFQDPLFRANHNWLEGVQVIGLGAGSEHGGFTGVAAYATLRSGTNRFNGLGELWTTRPGWLAKNTRTLSESLQKRFLSRELIDWRDSSAQLGGPIRRDRIWFFSGIQHTRHEDRPAGFSGPGSRDERDVEFVFKPTVSLSPGVRLDGFIGPGRRRVDGDYIAADTPIESSNDVRQRQMSWNSRATWTISSATVAEVRDGGYNISVVADPHPPATRLGPPPRFDNGTNRMSLNAYYYFEQQSRAHTTSATITHYAERVFGGSHELKLGIEYEATRTRQEYGFPGGRIYWDYFGAPGEVTIHAGDAGNATTGRRIAYLQDAWALTDRLTVTPGLRLEWNRGSAPNKPNLFATNTVAPRVGVAWDLTSDHRTVARVHYGHYYDALFASRIMYGDTSESSPLIYAQVVGPDQFVELFRSPAELRFAVDKDLRHSHVKQLVLGVERELFADFSVQLQYIRRRFNDFMGMIDTATIYNPVQRADPGPDGVLNNADDGAPLTVFAAANPGNKFTVYTNPPGAFNRYDAAQVVVRKRYSRDWQLQASYTWSRNRGTVGNRWHVNAARYDLGDPGRFVNPNTNINAFGRATFDPTHEGKLLGSYRLPWAGGTMVSAVYRYTTGQAWGRVANIRGLPQGNQRVRIEPVGTRRAPAINTLALRAEKTMPIPRLGGTLGLFLDAFNLSNQGVPDSDMTDAIVDNSGSRFGQPNHWLDPRMLRAGIRVTF